MKCSRCLGNNEAVSIQRLHLGHLTGTCLQVMPKASMSSASLLSSLGLIQHSLPTPNTGWVRAVRVCGCAGLSRRQRRKALDTLCIKLHIRDLMLPLQVGRLVFQLKWMKQILHSFVAVWPATVVPWSYRGNAEGRIRLFVLFMWERGF